MTTPAEPVEHEPDVPELLELAKRLYDANRTRDALLAVGAAVQQLNNSVAGLAVALAELEGRVGEK